MKHLYKLILGAVVSSCFVCTAFASPPIELTKEEEARAFFYSLPNDFFKSLLREPPIKVDGQTLHPKFQYYLEQRKSTMPAKEKRERQKKLLLDPEQRARMLAATDRNWTYRSKVTAPMKYTQDLEIPGPGGTITARAYIPETDTVETLPVIVYFHGGGWLFASVDAADRSMRLLANEADAIVISANYRMGPVHKFPAAHDDAYAVFKWARAHAAAFGGDPKRVGIGGDSAGGNMAVSVSYQLLQEGMEPPAMQLLYYPAVDRRMSRYKSYELFGEGYGLDKWFGMMMEELVYKSPEDKNNIRLSPMLAKSFKGMPPAIIATAGFDMLRDQGAALAKRLEEDGVETKYINYPSLIHGWLQWSGVLDDAEKASEETARWAGRMLRQ
tara:strand:+ start:20570 stop:21724 length:1155 start_codon:yes stop_codon:yes gene_type:complete